MTETERRWLAAMTERQLVCEWMSQPNPDIPETQYSRYIRHRLQRFYGPDYGEAWYQVISRWDDKLLYLP